MGINAKFTQSEVRARLKMDLLNMTRAIIETLVELGEMAINQARTFGSYIDQTGNLRSSVGYLVIVNGAVVRSAFKGGKDAGRIEGEKYARSLVSQFPRGYVLLVVAGMSYAATVEARGRDVLKSAQLLAEEKLPKLMRELKEDIDAVRNR